MKTDYRKLMLRALEDDLDAAERDAFKAALAADADLRSEWQNLRQIKMHWANQRADSFKPFFAARVMQRIGAQQRDSLTDGLLWMFKPLVSAMAVVALCIAINNWNERTAIDEETSVLEAIFSAEPVSLDAAYAMEQ